MRFSMIFAIAVTVASAAPAAAQNNAAANTATNLAVTPENVTAVNLTETNAATAATPAVQGPDAAEADTVTVTGKKPFPWGVLGLVGLIGLLGRRRSS
jgi:MYXO-CTERM domain-containing protein